MLIEHVEDSLDKRKTTLKIVYADTRMAACYFGSRILLHESLEEPVDEF